MVIVVKPEGSDPQPVRALEGRLAGAAGLAVAASVALAPLAAFGFPRGHDWLLELVRAAQWGAALVEGQGLPAWAPDLYHGFGSPIFVFYAPLASASTWLLTALTGSFAAAGQLTLALSWGVAGSGAVAMSRAARGAASRSPWSAADRVAAYCVVLSPYLLTDLYLRNANAELLGLSLLPWCLAWAIAERPRPLALGACLALLVLAHNLTAVAAVVILGVVALVPGAPYRIARLRVTLTGGLLAAGLTAWFWWPALTQRGSIRTEELLRGKLDFHHNFVPWAHTFGFTPPYAVGWLPVAALIAGTALAATARGRTRALALAASGLAGALLLLMHPVSVPVWEALPWLALFQFPWRLLGPLTVVIALLAGLAFHHWLRRFRPVARAGVELAVLVLAVAAALPVLQLVRPLPSETGASLDQRLSRAHVRASPDRATVLDEYLPRGACAELWRQGPVEVVAVPAQAQLWARESSGSTVRVDVELAGPGTLELGRWWFPGWRARAGSLELEVSRSDCGLAAVELPAGRHRVELIYRSPPGRRGGLAVSLATLIATLWTVRRRPVESEAR